MLFKPHFSVSILSTIVAVLFSISGWAQTDSADTAQVTITADSSASAPLTTGFAKTTKVYRFTIKDEIAPPVWRKTKKALRAARELDADIVFLNMNTYGGLVDAADSIRTAILQSEIPVYVLIENNAASAGALISIACDSIYMLPGSTIGAATVVNQSGEAVPDKYQSYMRKKMRATAEENGRNPDIAEAMVDPDKVVPGVSDEGKVVTFTTKEAVKYGYCDGVVSNMDEALALAGIEDYEVIEQEIGAVDNAIGWLISPAISGILILIIIGGIYFEMQTPGVGFPLIASIVAAVLYFAPLYLEGLADNWEILLFVGGIVLLALEIFVIPGFGVAGIAGALCIVLGLAFSLIPNVDLDFTGVDGSVILEAFLTVTISSLLSVFGNVYLGLRLISSGGPFSRYVLSATQQKEAGFVGTELVKDELAGQEGVAATVLRPGGKVELNGRLYDATSDGPFIEAGAKVQVVSSDTSSLIVTLADA